MQYLLLWNRIRFFSSNSWEYWIVTFFLCISTSCAFLLFAPKQLINDFSYRWWWWGESLLHVCCVCWVSGAQLRFSEFRRWAWVTLVSDILRMFTKECITQFQVRIPFSFFKYPFYKLLMTQNENSHTPLGMYGKYPWCERGKEFYFQYCSNLKRSLETCLLSFCSLST